MKGVPSDRLLPVLVQLAVERRRVERARDRRAWVVSVVLTLLLLAALIGLHAWMGTVHWERVEPAVRVP